MRRTALVAIVAFAAFLAPSSAFAWGSEAHRYIMSRAIDLLPAELKPFFEQHRDEVVLRVNDPDLWRDAGWDDEPNHYLDFDTPGLGPYPFLGLPRDYTAAVEKFGVAALRRIGLLPWREAEQFGNLRRAFEGLAGAPLTAADVVLFAAVTAHYIQDAHQPLHATINSDGQMTGQAGIHARFETALFERYRTKLTIVPVAVQPVTNARDAAFDVLLASHELVDPLLRADKEASGGRETYDDAYFERFFQQTRPILEKRIADSISMTVALIVGAWQEAGKPVLRAIVPPPVQKVR